MPRPLAGLFAAGATLALLTVVLPHAARANEAGLLVIVAGAYVVAFALSWRSANLKPWVLPVALALGTTLITGILERESTRADEELAAGGAQR